MEQESLIRHSRSTRTVRRYSPGPRPPKRKSVGRPTKSRRSVKTPCQAHQALVTPSQVLTTLDQELTTPRRELTTPHRELTISRPLLKTTLLTSTEKKKRGRPPKVKLGSEKEFFDNVIIIIADPNVFDIFGEHIDWQGTGFLHVLEQLAPVVTLKMDVVDPSVGRGPLDMADISEELTQHICDQIEEVSKTNPEAHVVLVGWGVTCRLVQRALETAAGVSAVILFAYPPSAVLADPDDSANLTYCPTLFVCGEAWGTSYLEGISETCQYYINRTALVTVANADEDLQIISGLLQDHCLSKAIVDRGVRDFIKQLLEAANPNIAAHREAMKPINPTELNRRQKVLLLPPKPSTYQPRGNRGRSNRGRTLTMSWETRML
uniref:AB hydrolase-1 domain-containing protein n=1 Tax=Steinernema glaseri TaxID=37863 RepID=A0A1I7ZQE8_9BILA